LVAGHFPALLRMLFTSAVLSAANLLHSYMIWSAFCWSEPQGHVGLSIILKRWK